MRRLIFGSVMLSLLLVAIAAPAWAAEKLEGVDFSLRIPAGFRARPQSGGSG